jgi:hypothetical protein
MKLHTQCYLPQTTHEAVDPLIGLPDLRKGLHTILFGYLLWLGSVLAAAGIVICLIYEVSESKMSRQAIENASTVLFALILILPLVGLASLALVVRGKWLCLASAPERYHAKWMMFLAILCILAGPLLNVGVNFVGESEPKSGGRAAKAPSLIRLKKEIDTLQEGLPELDTRAYVRLAGQGIGLLSGVFFVLFLRAVALCNDAPIRARFTEMYLLLLGVLVYGVYVLIRDPNFMMRRPQLLLGLGAGWILSGLWYLGLIVWTSLSISMTLARPSRPLAPVAKAPIAPALPPLPEMAIRK